MITSLLFSLSIFFFNQTPLLIESFTNDLFPPVGWDTLRSGTNMGNWYRYNYKTGNPDQYQARLRVYDYNDTLRTGWSTLKTPILDLATNPGQESLFFWYRFSLSSGNLGPDDTMYVDITNDDITWINLLKIDPGADTNIWQIARINLSTYDTFQNARIRFHYEDRPNGSINPSNCNFWLDSVKVVSDEEYIMPIAQAFRDLDSNYIPDLLNSIVTITGVITAPPGVFLNNEAYLQDNTGGICLYGNFPVTLDYGDSIIATGMVDQYNGKNELTNFSYSLIAHNATVPEPIEIDGGIMNTEYYEGSLIKIKISYFEGFLLQGNYNYDAWDTLNNQFTVRVHRNTNIPGHFAPIDTFTLTGIKGQYTTSSPPSNGYQLLPRDTFDFSHLFIMPTIKNIQEVQTPGSDGVSSKYVDSILAIEGVLTGPNYVFTSGSPSFYIQDETGGINIYNPDGDSAFMRYIDSLGARLRVIGKVTEYNGLTEIANGYGWFLGMDTVPLPKELLSNRFLTEGMEGSLIKMKGVVSTTPYLAGPGYNFDIMNGDVGITVRFTIASGINPSTIKKDEEKEIIGIVGQYDTEGPYTTGYQLMPRFPEDIGIPGYDSASTAPMLELVGPKTFIPSIGEQAQIQINSPLDYRLELNIHDMSGRIVKRLYSGAGGPNMLYWDGKDDLARPCKVGIYLLNLNAVNSTGDSSHNRLLIVIGNQ